MDFAVLPDHKMKIKENERQVLESHHRSKKLWNMGITVILIVIGALVTIPKSLERGLEELKIGGRIETIQTIKIGQNTEKSPGDLRRLAVAQTAVKDHQ